MLLKFLWVRKLEAQVIGYYRKPERQAGSLGSLGERVWMEVGSFRTDQRSYMLLVFRGEHLGAILGTGEAAS